jgi:hypothetical protein
MSRPVEEKQGECECTSEGPDGLLDLTLTFDTPAIVAALGSVKEGNGRVITITGTLNDGTVIEGKDCVVIRRAKTIVFERQEIPVSYTFSQNSPNPFNLTTTIHYTLPVTDGVTLKVIDVLGQEVAVLVEDDQEAGRYTVIFDGDALPSGVYFYRLQMGECVEIRRMLLMK